jgi:hypothetical protein
MRKRTGMTLVHTATAGHSASSAGFARAIRFWGRFGRGAEPPSEVTAAHGGVVAHGAARS